MSRNRKEISMDIEKLNVSQIKLQGDLAALEGQEKEALALVEDEFLSTGASKSASSLADLRAKKGVIQEGLSIVSTKMHRLQGELSDFDFAESLAPWRKFEKDLPTRINRIRVLLGRDGLEGEFISLKADLDSISSFAEKTSQEAMIVTNILAQICAKGSAQIFEILNSLNNAEIILDNSHPK